MSQDATTTAGAGRELRFGEKLAVFAGDIKLAHTVFALPFALLSTVLAWKMAGGSIWAKLGLIGVCMVTARTLAMSSNRLLDAALDARNPRTRGRAIPSGKLSRAFYAVMIVCCAAGFILATAGFLYWRNPWPLQLGPLVLAFLGAYPLLKRFTRLCHWYLGAALGLAPVCAWIAIGAKLDWTPIIMGGAVLLWTAGFDIIYACQDYQSDLETGVVSLPAKIGIGGALVVARITHALSAALLVVLGFYSPDLRLLYAIGAAAAIVLLVVEHALVKSTDLSRAGLAFFTMNGIISVLLGALGIVGATAGI